MNARNVSTDSPLPHTRAEASAHEPDEALVARLDGSEKDALRALHHRYAALVFTVAARFVDVPTAEEVVQDVFFTLWKKHETFDPARGTFKSWIVQIARRRALTELRRKQGRGQESDEALAQLSDDALEPDEASWLAHRRAVIQAAVDALPEAQKQALSLAFFDELTHEQIASVLHTPVGTTKTRIRLALKRLAPVLLVVVAVTLVAWVMRRRDERVARSERALKMVTASDVVPLRLGPAAGVPADAHGSYRTRPGAGVAVLTTNHLPALDAPEAYVAWAHRPDGWRSLGPVVVESDGRSLLVSEVDPGGAPSDEIRVTRERGSLGEVPRGTTVLTGSPPSTEPR
jgi:RNA polymerase sigma-70 factor (ECF subfamily)